MDVQRPEPPSEGHLVFRAEGLVPEEDDLMLDQGGADLGDHAIGQVSGQVGAGNLGAQGSGDLADGQAHAVLPQAEAHNARRPPGCKALQTMVWRRHR